MTKGTHTEKPDVDVWQMLRCFSGSSNCVVCTDGTAVQLNKHA